jgi:predicted dehydrogenase
MSMRQTRRSFLKKGLFTAGLAAGAATGLFRAPRILAQASPNSTLGVAVVGVGGMGNYSFGCSLNERCVALVDVDDNVMDKAWETAWDRGHDPKCFFDYRTMLDKCHKDIDVVLVSTPDHNHAPACIRAIDLGKAAFSQKPLAHNIRECYVLAKAAKEKKVCTQMGNQGHCGEGIRVLCEAIWAGAVGNVLESHTILGRNFGGKGGQPPGKPVPASLHWDEWIGPAPFREYHDGLHTFSWRSWRDFGTGTIGDMACHHLDGPFWAMKIGEVKKFTVECLNTTGGSVEMFPQDNVVRYDIPARGDMPAMKLFVYDHDKLMPDVMKEAQEKNNRKFGEYTLYVGDKGLIGSDARILPEEKQKEFKAPAKTLPRAHGGGPVEDLFWCIRNNGTPCSNFTDSAGPLTSFALCGHLAQFAGVGKKIEWDVEKMECTNMPEINQYVKRTYRKGWEV